MAAGRSFKGPLVTTGIGAVLIVASVVLWVLSLNQLSRSVDAFALSGERIREEQLGETDLPGELTVDLTSGEHVVYFFGTATTFGPGATTTTSELGGPGTSDPTIPSSRSNEPLPAEFARGYEITITGPSGETPTSWPSVGDYASSVVSTVGVWPIWVFDAITPGEYTISVERDTEVTTAFEGDIEGFGVGARADFDEASSAGLRSVGIFLVALVVGGIGTLVVLIGLIWLLVAALSGPRVPPGGYGPPGGVGYSAPSGYGPPPGYGPPGQPGGGPGGYGY